MKKIIYSILFIIGVACIFGGLFIHEEINSQKRNLIARTKDIFEGNFRHQMSQYEQGQSFANVLLLTGAILGIIGFLGFLLAFRKPQITYTTQVDKYEQLERLQNLLDKGTISIQEFEREKKKVLKN
ncbi:MAG: SHOCT domain-containing protein [Spirosomataceae bacterium]